MLLRRVLSLWIQMTDAPAATASAKKDEATVAGGVPQKDKEGNNEVQESSPLTNEARQEDWMRKFVERERGMGPGAYTNEFFTIRVNQDKLRMENADYGTTTAAHPVHYARNRYRDILPYDANRVLLKSASPAEGNGDGYVNASHITLPNGKTTFIAAQAPLPTTLEEFWQLVHEQGVTLIVMLCKTVEMSKVKCEQYWPEKPGTSEVFGMFEVTLQKEERFDDDEYVQRTLLLKGEEDREGRIVTQLHYREWPDHGCPAGNQQLLNMIDRMAANAGTTNTDERPPVLVHCSAGVGRTGTIIAINYIRELMEQNLFFDLKLIDLVNQLRRQRSSMVQTQDQYVFVHRCVSAYCRRLLGLPLDDPPADLPPVPPAVAGNAAVEESDSEDEDMDSFCITAVPDYPEEPRAPRGPEDLNGAV